MVSAKLGNKGKLNFDEFFVIEKEVLLTQLKNNPTIEVDSTQIEPTNFFCPYAQEVTRNWDKWLMLIFNKDVCWIWVVVVKDKEPVILESYKRRVNLILKLIVLAHNSIFKMELTKEVQNLLALVNQKVTTQPPASSKVQLPSNEMSLGELAELLNVLAKEYGTTLPVLIRKLDRVSGDIKAL